MLLLDTPLCGNLLQIPSKHLLFHLCHLLLLLHLLSNLQPPQNPSPRNKPINANRFQGMVLNFCPQDSEYVKNAPHQWQSEPAKPRKTATNPVEVVKQQAQGDQSIHNQLYQDNSWSALLSSCSSDHCVVLKLCASLIHKQRSALRIQGHRTLNFLSVDLSVYRSTKVEVQATRPKAQ